MGWDAYATKHGHPIKKDWSKKGKIIDPTIRRIFAKAAKLGADWMLPIGGLDCSCYGEALAEATGESVYSEKPWSPKKVKELANEANWSLVEDQANVSCAKAFLEACAKANLGICFSW